MPIYERMPDVLTDVVVFHTRTKLENPGFDQPVTAFSFLSISVFTTSKIMEHAPDM
jgi:hypothetical protein